MLDLILWQCRSPQTPLHHNNFTLATFAFEFPLLAKSFHTQNITKINPILRLTRWTGSIRHEIIWKDKVISITPFFFGSNPAEVKEGPHKGLRLQPKVKDLAFDLIEDLDKGQQSSAIIFDEAPLDILTFNAARASLPKEQGLAASKMNSTQKEILTALITEYTSKVRSEIADSRLDTILSNLDGIHFAWGGPVDKSQAHYYRLHGGDFVVEYDNRQNGANHIHSVWRDVSNDFAGDVMRDHLYMYHVL